MSDTKIITNFHARDIIHGYELSPAERAEFDYIDTSETLSWDDAEFFRYRGQLYDIGEFSADYGIMRGSGLPAHLSRWDGYMSDSYFSAIVMRFARDEFGPDFDHVVVGLVLS